MSASTITITFTDDLVINDRLIFCMVTNPDTYSLNWYQNYKWVNLRSSTFQVTTGTPIVDSLGERAAINFKTAFELDNNMFLSSGAIEITRNVNEITITAPNTETFIQFTEENIVPNTSTDGSINVVIVDGTFNPFLIESVVFSEADTTPCQNAKITVTASENIKNVNSPITATDVNNTVYSFDFPRNQTINLEIEDYSSNLISQLIGYPAVLSPDDFELQINPSPNGASVIVNNISTNHGYSQLELEYSLDGVEWQNSNIFSGLVSDSYTLHIKDQLGCSKTIDFEVDEYGIQIPYFIISKANSIRFANRITWGDSANYKNDENTLSCESNVALPYKEIQQFQSADVITTQFQSNYSDISVTVIKENGDEVSVPIVQKSNHIGLKDLRDARKYNLGGGKTGIYFTTGNIYDFDTGTDTGNDYTLYGVLPEWAIIGNYVKVGFVWYLIEDRIYDENKNAEVIVISDDYTGLDTSIIAGSIYNNEPFEVYEFTIDMVDYLDQKIQVRINNNDDVFWNLTHLSEIIYVKVKHEGTVEIRYKNDSNLDDMYYSTGIEHLIRLPINKVNGRIDDSSETYKTDTTAILLTSEIYELDEFLFEPVTKEIMRKLTQALSHKFVKIDSVDYVKSASIEVEGALEETNLYEVKAVMIKAANVYNSQSGDGNNQFATGSSEIIGLIDSGDGYVAY